MYTVYCQFLGKVVGEYATYEQAHRIAYDHYNSDCEIWYNGQRVY